MRGGVRGAEWLECGKHGEGFSYAEGRNKGESGVGFALGARRRLRSNASGLFAFIRYESHGSALKAIGRMNGRVIEVVEKEFGSEVYSVQSHPDLQLECSASMEDTTSQSKVEETLVGYVQTPTRRGDHNLNFSIVGDPQLEARIEDRPLIFVNNINSWSDNGGIDIEVIRREAERAVVCA
ncbi:hypothetical protein PIB30_009182 [Stylosanthes scabra]|uniref:RRM domain-containing protein n=1 Tax=Stylosanthes scabra TaxID=79078 RepID=A0ABU6Y3M7_9FABA|nr:hypothetical protein [Stylosanthes scabra]